MDGGLAGLISQPDTASRGPRGGGEEPPEQALVCLKAGSSTFKQPFCLHAWSHTEYPQVFFDCMYILWLFILLFILSETYDCLLFSVPQKEINVLILT